MAQWHKRNNGVKVRFRGEFKDVVWKTPLGYRVKIERREDGEKVMGGGKAFRLQRDAIAALDRYLAKAEAEIEANSHSHNHDEGDGNTPCDGCNGSGIYYGRGYVENGVFKGFTGKCFRCNGRGYQTESDIKRNTYYDNHVRRVEP